METLDCKDIRVLLSGLVDDEVEAGTRRLAERHLVDCRSCRTVINEAETLDELVRLDVESMIDPGGLPEGFEGAVLSRTVYEREPKIYMQRWTTWTGWLAAAAALALAVTIWMSEQRTGMIADTAPISAGGGGGAVHVMPAAYTTSEVYRSFTLDADQTPDASLLGTERTPTLEREDAESIYFASVLLGLMNDGNATDAATTVRDALEYESLLPTLAELRPRLAAADRATLLAAESVLTRVAMGPVTENDLAVLQETVRSLDLTRSLDLISRRWSTAQSI